MNITAPEFTIARVECYPLGTGEFKPLTTWKLTLGAHSREFPSYDAAAVAAVTILASPVERAAWDEGRSTL